MCVDETKMSVGVVLRHNKPAAYLGLLYPKNEEGRKNSTTVHASPLEKSLAPRRSYIVSFNKISEACTAIELHPPLILLPYITRNHLLSLMAFHAFRIHVLLFPL